jgi:beta-N-acetylhexosaminidase
MQEKPWLIETYRATTDLAATFLLWQAAIGQIWPIDFQRFQQILAAPRAEHFVVREQGQIIGFAATSHSPAWGKEIGYFLALLVAPNWQRRGLGAALHEHALNHLRAAGVDYFRLGGHSPRFWCGVPENLPGALAFFQARGWEYAETVYDLSQNLSQYHTPPAIEQRMLQQQITLNLASEADMPAILAFEEREFPNWLQHYERLARLGEYRDVLMARDHDGQVLGALLMSTPQSHTERTDVVWRVLLGSDAGSMGAVGVAPSAQGRGIGIALVARASDLLKTRGIRNCYIDWVVITDFYAKLGYKKWRAFKMSERE